MSACVYVCWRGGRDTHEPAHSYTADFTLFSAIYAVLMPHSFSDVFVFVSCLSQDWICLFSLHARFINHKFAFLNLNLIGFSSTLFIHKLSFLELYFPFQKTINNSELFSPFSTALSAYFSILSPSLTYTTFLQSTLGPRNIIKFRTHKLTAHTSLLSRAPTLYRVMPLSTARRRLLRYFFAARNTFNC